jgi:anti-anti-sigma regulatory factor
VPAERITAMPDWLLHYRRGQPRLDVESLDMLGELADELGAQGVELRLASARAPVLELLRRAGLTDRLRIEPTVDAATEAPTAP